MSVPIRNAPFGQKNATNFDTNLVIQLQRDARSISITQETKTKTHIRILKSF